MSESIGNYELWYLKVKFSFQSSKESILRKFHAIKQLILIFQKEIVETM